ncbi:MAG: MATE family efflux transporter [[Clostridium] innocuum]
MYAASAVGIASKFDIFAMLPATSVSNALTALTAQNLAAGKKERAVGFVRYGICVSMLCSSLFFLWAQLSPQSMISLFSRDAAVIRAGIPLLRGCSLDYLVVSILFCMNGYLEWK